MPETHYIEIDEEIISAVSRLRKSGSAENIFVFPKRSLILQSIINLKLLGREAEKLGKKVIVMTQDEQGMRLAEKAGLRTEEYQDSAFRESRQEAAARFTVRHGESIPMPAPVEPHDGLRRSSEIGSASFYGDASIAPSHAHQPLPSPAASPLPPVSEKRPQTLRVRNMTPPLQTSLNSVRSAESSAAVTAPRSRELVPPQLATASPTLRRELPKNDPQQAEAVRKEKLRRLFEGRGAAQANPGISAIRPANPEPPIVAAKRPNAAVSLKGSRGPWLWSMFGALLFLGIFIGGYLYLRPEAIVAIEPQSVTQSVKLSLVGAVEGVSGSNMVPARYVEEEKTIRFSREATGKDLGSAAKASGTITISNAFSEASQPLVATTRFETPDGKLYRLVEGVTVPGAKTEDGKTLPGKIDARVMADQAGTKYNLSSGTFTIPGFKGGPKYDKITAEAKGAFSGGSNDASGAKLSVSQSDLDMAKAAASDEAKKAVISSLSGGLKEGEAALEPSFQVALLGTPVAPAVGSGAEMFEYEARFQVKGFVISESAVREIIDREKTESGGVVLRPYRYSVSYGAVLANFETRRVDFTVESKVLFRAPLNDAALKSGLLGLDEEGIRSYLAEHPDIKRLQVEFKPKVFIATIPDDPERVRVNIIESENE